MSEGNLSQEAVAGGASSDDEVEQNDDIWLRADTTPPATSKFCSNEGPAYEFYSIISSMWIIVVGIKMGIWLKLFQVEHILNFWMGLQDSKKGIFWHSVVE